MAISRICSVNGCDKKVWARGLCPMHLARLKRNGSPERRKRPANGEAQAFFENVVLPYDGDDCLVWPFSRNPQGYAELRMNGVTKRVHRLVCEAVNGPAPDNDSEALHSCGRGSHGCVSKNHLNWGTHAENMADMVRHGNSPRGERHGNAKLTADDVRIIRRLPDSVSREEIAKMFSIGAQHVTDIRRRKRWAWLDR